MYPSTDAPTQPPAIYQPDEKAILPFQPPGTFAPGTFAPGSSVPGRVPVLAPSYPLKPYVDNQQQQTYPCLPASLTPKATFAHPTSATIPTMGGPGPTGFQTYDANPSYNTNGPLGHSRSVTAPAGHPAVDIKQLQTGTSVGRINPILNF